MTVLNGHYHGACVVLDEPVPFGIPAPTPVKVVFEDAAETVLDRIAKLGGPAGLPPDYAEQHEHYVKGAPRKRSLLRGHVVPHCTCVSGCVP